MSRYSLKCLWSSLRFVVRFALQLTGPSPGRLTGQTESWAEELLFCGELRLRGVVVYFPWREGQSFPPSNWTTRVVFCHFPWTRFCLRVLLTLRGSGLCVSFQDAQPAVFLNLTAQSKNNSLSFLKLSLYNMMLLSNELMLFFLVKASTWVSYLNLWLHGVCRITVLCFYIQNRACDGQMEAQQGIHNLSWCLGWCFSASNIYEHKKCSLKK